MLHPTRSNLLLLREKLGSVANSVTILKSRRQALIAEFLQTSIPYLESRRRIRTLYGEGIVQLRLALGHHGPREIESLCGVTGRKFQIAVSPKKLWGLEYKEIVSQGSAVRPPDGRDYDYPASTPALEEACWRFERIVDAILDLAAHDNKLKRLSREINITTRRMRVLEERTMPLLKHQIRFISQYIAERERESHFRLKRFKEARAAP